MSCQEAGNRAVCSFEDLVRATQTESLRRALRMLGNREAAEDLLADVYAELYPKLRDGQIRTTPEAFLSWLLRRRGIDRLRARKRAQSPLSLDAVSDPLASEGTSLGEHLPSRHRTEDEGLLAPLRAQLAAFLASLPTEDRFILEHYYAGWSDAELATLVGAGREATKKRRQRAEKRLRARWFVADLDRLLAGFTGAEASELRGAFSGGASPLLAADALDAPRRRLVGEVLRDGMPPYSPLGAVDGRAGHAPAALR